METRAATFPGCAMITHWLPHTPVQIFFCLFLMHKIVWCSLSSSSIQTGVLEVTFCITLMYQDLVDYKPQKLDMKSSSHKGYQQTKSFQSWI